MLSLSQTGAGPEVLRRLRDARRRLLAWVGEVSNDQLSLVCQTVPEPIFVGYSEHESARGTTERPE